MSLLARLRLRVVTKRFLQSQVDEWRLAHKRWCAEKLRLEAEINDYREALSDALAEGEQFNREDCA